MASFAQIYMWRCSTGIRIQWYENILISIDLSWPSAVGEARIGDF
jgi:hypothetical protein